jgi:hypothetical protein
MDFNSLRHLFFCFVFYSIETSLVKCGSQKFTRVDFIKNKIKKDKIVIGSRSHLVAASPPTGRPRRKRATI